MGSGFIRFGAWEVDEIHAIAGTFPDEAPLPLLCGFHQAHKLSKLKIRVDILGWLWYDKISLDRLINEFLQNSGCTKTVCRNYDKISPKIMI